MSALTLRYLFGSIAALSLVTAPALAEVPDLCPKREGSDDVDPAAQIALDAFAGAALDAAKVGVTLYARASALAPLDGLSPIQSVLVRGATMCSDKPGMDTIRCSKNERQSLGQAQFKLFDLLRNPAFIGVPRGGAGEPIPTPAALFQSGAVIRCAAPKPPVGGAVIQSARSETPEDSDARPRWSLNNFRVRGTPADIIYPRGSSAYSDADKAKLTIGRDSGKSSTTLIGTIGYALPIIGEHNIEARKFTTLDLIPFFAVNLDSSRKKGEPRNVTSDAIAFGFSLEYDVTTAYQRDELDADGRKVRRFAAFDSYLAATPKYAINYADDSALAGLNLIWRPAISLGSITEGVPINIQRKLGTLPLGWSLIADVRSNSGIYVRTGSRTGNDARDFVRVGGRVGLGIASIAKSPIPFEFSVTESAMWALTGKPGHVGQLASSLTLYFNDDKIFGVELAYKRGRIEDQDERDDAWSLGLVAKY